MRRPTFVAMHGWRLGLRCWFATAVGPWFPLAWYVAPKWKRDKWHRIACDDESCAQCEDYYAQYVERYGFGGTR